VNRPAGDWVYFVLEPPSVSTTFSVVLGWSKRGRTTRSNAAPARVSRVVDRQAS
jgi:hypothetical protein